MIPLRHLFFTAALVLGVLPALVAAFLLLPWVLLGVFMPPHGAPWKALGSLLVLAASLVALGGYGVLAVRTLKGRAWAAGPGPRWSAAAGLVAAATVGWALPAVWALVVLVPLAAALALAVARQRALQDRAPAPQASTLP